MEGDVLQFGQVMLQSVSTLYHQAGKMYLPTCRLLPSVAQVEVPKEFRNGDTDTDDDSDDVDPVSVAFCMETETAVAALPPVTDDLLCPLKVGQMI